MPFLPNIACIEDHHDYSYSPILVGTLQTKIAQFCDTFQYELRDVWNTKRASSHHGVDLIGVKSEWRRPGMAVIL